MVVGYMEEAIERMRIDEGMSNEEFQSMVRSRLLGAMSNNGIRQKVVPVAHIKDYISQGWEFVAMLPDNRVIIRLPS
ncbi:MAG: hypothetical protein ACK4FV_06670 [Candidatus Nitrosocaldus sp.]